MILSTEDHQELMKNVAAKTGAQLSLLPTIPLPSDDGKSLQIEFSHNVKGR